MRWWIALLPIAAAAHVVSMSTGEAKLAGTRLDYELRMPLYEIAQLPQAEAALLANVHFLAGGAEASLVKHSCQRDQTNLICNAEYQFARNVDEFEVRCTFPSITVPNHVHMFRATHGDRNDSTAFDGSFTKATLRFRAPRILDTLARESAAGFWRAFAGPAQILFLLALLLAARGWRDLAQLFAMFAAGQAIAAALAPRFSIHLSPRFIEAAAALTIAYFAVEILLLPEAGGRWAIAGVLGLFHGMYLAMLVAAGEYQAVPYVIGALAAEALLALVLWQALRRLHYQRIMASLLLLVGLGWFIQRLIS